MASRQLKNAGIRKCADTFGEFEPSKAVSQGIRRALRVKLCLLHYPNGGVEFTHFEQGPKRRHAIKLGPVEKAGSRAILLQAKPA